MSDTTATDTGEEVFDLDAFRAANNEATPKVKKLRIDGEEYTLPARLPASFMLIYSEIAALPEAEGMVKALEIFPTILGEDYRRILDKIELGELEPVMEGTLALYGVDPGKLQGSAGSSVTISDPSKRTSKGSTR